MSLQPSFSTRFSYATWLFVANSAFSIYVTWGGLLRNGYFSALRDLWSRNPPCVPGSDIPILTTYTFIPPLDKLITFSTILFANITDGTTPQFSLFAFYFTGQWASILTIIFSEGLKISDGGSGVASSMAWLLFMQLVTYACGMPVYGLFSVGHGTGSLGNRQLPSASNNKATNALSNLPLAIIVGYGIPTALISIPFENHNLHQWFNGVWQGHPIWIVLVHRLLGVMRESTDLSLLGNLKASGAPDVRTAPRDGHPYSATHGVYLFAFSAAALTHISSFAILGSAALFPTLFSEWAHETITFKEVYQPSPVWRSASWHGMAPAALDFFQYDMYCGSIASFIWALYLHLKSRKSPLTVRQSTILAIRILGSGLVAGPSAVVVCLLWSRDEDEIPANQQSGCKDD